MLRIHSVSPGSPASRAGIRPEDRLLSCDGMECLDWLDFAMHATGCSVAVELARGPRRKRIRLSRTPGREWGLRFHGQEPRQCGRNCVFCFVDQLPSGVRPSLLIKDDDIHHSFFYGSYVTLRQRDVAEVIRRRLSPVHVSVHTTDPVLRGRMLGSASEEPILPMLSELSSADTSVETQIVAVPGWNDGPELERSLLDLLQIPGVTSVGVVPVGLTAHRSGLEPLRRPVPEEARETLDICHRLRERAMIERGWGWVYPADEFFIMAGTEIPPREYYEGCELLENGIGLLSRLLNNEGRTFSGKGVVCTGTLAAPFLSKVLSGSDYRVLAVDNGFLGADVGVAGLLSGGDIVRAVREYGAGDTPVILPGRMFNDSMLSIDGFTPEHIAGELEIDITVASSIEELD